MAYRNLLREGRIRAHRTNADEIASLFAVTERDLADAATEQLSPDRRFATAYNAVLQVATIVMYSEGYRTRGAGHHATTFDFLALVDKRFSDLSVYLHHCRRKRNLADYVGVGYVSETEAAELLKEATSVVAQVRQWLHRHYPELMAEEEEAGDDQAD